MTLFFFFFLRTLPRAFPFTKLRRHLPLMVWWTVSRVQPCPSGHQRCRSIYTIPCGMVWSPWHCHIPWQCCIVCILILLFHLHVVKLTGSVPTSCKEYLILAVTTLYTFILGRHLPCSNQLQVRQLLSSFPKNWNSPRSGYFWKHFIWNTIFWNPEKISGFQKIIFLKGIFSKIAGFRRIPVFKGSCLRGCCPTVYKCFDALFQIVNPLIFTELRYLFKHIQGTPKKLFIIFYLFFLSKYYEI